MSTPTSSLHPIKVWGKAGPNPPKVAMILTELGIPHEVVPISFPDLKKDDFLALNPNGRMPAIQDPNFNGSGGDADAFTLWESGAIIEYIVERYDTARKLSFEPGSAEAYQAKQWLFFQTTGQGPYFGQAVWFNRFHPEKVPSAVERYEKEIARVSGVLEGHLEREKAKAGGKGDGPWLVGNKLSYADIAFVPWQYFAGSLLGKENYDEDKFPRVKEWLGKLMAKESIGPIMKGAMQH